MDPFQYQQQQQLQYQQQYGQQQVQFVPAYPYNVQAQTANQHGQHAASGQYGGTFTAFSQQPMNTVVAMYPNVVPETQFNQNQGQIFTPTAFAGQTLQTPLVPGPFQFQQQQPSSALQPNNAVDKASLPATTSTSFVPPPMNHPTLSLASSSGVQPSVQDINQQYNEQLQKWQQQYSEWQAQHANHPDQKLFQEYQQQVQQWQQQQQQMLHVQGVNYNQQSQLQTPHSQNDQSQTILPQQLNQQVSPSKTALHQGQAQSQTMQALSANMSEQSLTNQQIPSSQYQSSTSNSNQGPGVIKDKNEYHYDYNNMQNFSNTAKHQGNIQQFDKTIDNKKVDHSHWQHSQQGNQFGRQNNTKTSMPSNQNLQDSTGKPKNDFSRENNPQWQQNKQYQQHSQYGRQNTKPNIPPDQTLKAGSGKSNLEFSRENNQQWQQNKQYQQHNQYGRQNTKPNIPPDQTLKAGSGKSNLEFSRETNQQWQQNKQYQQHNQYGRQNTKPNIPPDQTLKAGSGKSNLEFSRENSQQWQQNKQYQQHNQYGRQNTKPNIPPDQTLKAGSGKSNFDFSRESNQQWQQNQQYQQHNQYGRQNTKPNVLPDQTVNASSGKSNSDFSRENNQQWQQNQQYQQHNQYGRQNAKSNVHVPSDQNLQGSRPKSNVSNENSEQGAVKKDLKPLPNWMQSQGDKSQKEQTRSTPVNVSTPKWLQGDTKMKTPEKVDPKPLPKWQTEKVDSKPLPKWQTEKVDSKPLPKWQTEKVHVDSKPLPKWLQNSPNEKPILVQKGFQGQDNRPQTNKQENEPVKEQLNQLNTTKETKPIPKWLQETKPSSTQSSSTKQTVVTKQTQSSQVQQPSSVPAVTTTSSAFGGIHVQKLDPKQELELLQKQSLQLLQLAQLEQRQKDIKPANQPLPQTSNQSEQKTEVPNNQALSGSQESQKSSHEVEKPIKATAEQSITQDVLEPSQKEKLKDDSEKPQASTSKLKAIACRFFPNCRYGAECKFRHPPCTSGKSCTTKDCSYDHSDLPDESLRNNLKDSSFASFSKQDDKIPGIGDDSHYVKPAVDTQERLPPVVKDSQPFRGNDFATPEPVRDDRYPEERRGELNEWRDEDWRRWRSEWDRDPDRNERRMPPRDRSPLHWDERERFYQRNREEWERSERLRPWRDDWERSPGHISERDRWPAARGDEYRRYEDERWDRPAPDDWDYPPYREGMGHRPLSPRYRREPGFDRERSPARDVRERPYYDRGYREEPPCSRPYDELDGYGRPLSPPPNDYDRRREWEDRRREYDRPSLREPDWRDRRDPLDRQSDRYIGDYGYPGRGRSPPLDVSRPSYLYDRQTRYQDYPPDHDRRDAHWDRRDVDRLPDNGRDAEWRRNTGVHEDLGYHDQPHSREVAKPEKMKTVVVPVETVLDKPGRDSRPDRIVIILRGLPGSGKTHVARLVKDKEAANGAHAPRIISLDDYFLTEVEKQEKDPETGKRVKKKVTEYLFESEMEDVYRASMFKSFSKTLEDGFFPVVMVDAINNKVEHFEKYWSFAKQKGFEVYIAELSADAHVCAKRNSHSRTFEEISKIQSDWEESPTHMLRLDVRSLLQDAVITEVEMETADETTASELPKDSSKTENNNGNEEEDEDVPKSGIHIPQRSKWDDMDSSAEAQLNKLDGIRPLKRRREASPPVTLSDDEDPYDEKEEDMRIGKKRVRWADIEENKHMEHRRRIGFCIGTDWSLLTDPNAKIPEH